ncbi:protein translocase subunit SecF [uncultured Ferrovibrio sp.]|jgi:preprotein translocase subunit SecF|uniref:protein translocase subunit SecF n=1 Tax=uncultured Ferrovibrio sp. TaxID=1576913 RepID=UPI0026186A18|nr:protein translocase subunit SecF [uncultured Ferrovibrio sp.]
MFRLRLIPDNTNIKFMKGRFVGLAMSAFLSIASIILFFYPGLNYGIDFRGGILMEVRLQQPADFPALRNLLGSMNLGEVALQEFGSPRDLLIRLERQGDDDAAQNAAAQRVRTELSQAYPGAEMRRVEVVGGKISAELFQSGLIAVGLALLAIAVYIWFRFEWMFALAAFITLLLDITKMIGFYAVTQLPFGLTAVAAVLTIIGYSINDKVVVYDRMRENLRKYKTMPLRELIDRSINETLSRTLFTSVTTFLAMVPLAFMGGEAVEVFAIGMLFGIIVGTSSSIFIAAPLVLITGEKWLRRRQKTNTEAETKAKATPAGQRS